jgi:DNA polymerase bacteriophage-type
VTATPDLSIDFETRSRVDLGKRGVWRYMKDASTEPLMASFSINHGDMQRWRPDAPCPQAIVDFVAAGNGFISAHNAAFERLLWQLILTPRYGWPEVPTERFRCTAATSAALGLPRSLEFLGTALNLDVQKDKIGKSLIQFFSIPRKDGRFNEPADNVEKFEQFHDYCDGDVSTEEAADKRMIPLSDYEQRVYTLDQIINDRGIRIDRRSAMAAIRLAEKSKIFLDREMARVTKGEVRKCTEVGKLVEWVKNRGVELDSLGKAEITEVLTRDGLPEAVVEALNLRKQAAKTSVSKLNTMLARADDDGRVRHSFLYHKASTGRWQSVGVNFGNMPRPRKDYEDSYLDTALLFSAFRSESPEYLQALYGKKLGSPLDLVSDAIRGFLFAAPGHRIVQADYSSIEGCVIAWTSGEDWKVKALQAIFEDPSLPDMYIQTAAGILGIPVEKVTKFQRQAVGKVSELALGFAGGVSAFYAMARNYAVDLDAMYEPVWATASEERRMKAEKRYANAYKRGSSRAREMSRQAWIACELIKVGWRATNSKIAEGWSVRERAVRDAIANPGTVVPALKVKYIVAHGYLFCQLPSGRCLAYASPKLRDAAWVKLKCEDGSWSDAEVMERERAEKLALEGNARIEGDTSPVITALGLDKTGRKMQRETLYGGILAENDTQAIARDILVNGMFQAEAAGYPIIGHVYDEMFAELPHGRGSVKEFERIICQKPAWAEGLPLAADGWEGKRYRK